MIDPNKDDNNNFMLNQCLHENIGEGLLHVCISSQCQNVFLADLSCNNY
jgi:hypothetical protein